MSKSKGGMDPKSGDAASGKGEFATPKVADTGSHKMTGGGGAGEYTQVTANTGK